MPDSETSETGERPARRVGRGMRISIGIGCVALVALFVAWMMRKPIAQGFIDRELASAQVPARYDLADLGLGRQRLTNVVLGDPADPDLVADWVETRTGIGLSGPYLASVAAGHVRMRGRLANGKLSLGAIDRLLPAPSGKPFALPALSVDVGDVRMRLETPAGLVGLKLAGSGRLDDGFSGSLAAISERLSGGGCTASRMIAAVRLKIARARPSIVGPVRIGDVTCGANGLRQLAADMDVVLAPALDRWQGTARLTMGRAGTSVASLGGINATVRFAGSAAATQGAVDLAGTRAATRYGTAQAIGIKGTYRIGRDVAFDGHVQASHATVASAFRSKATALTMGAAGTPIGPLAVALADAVARAGRDFAGDADLSVARGGATLSRLALAAASGARVTLSGGSGIALGDAGVRLDTVLALGGGGLPQGTVSLAQARPGAPIRGVARIAPYAAGGARLALTPVTFSATPGGATRIATRMDLSGPLGDGRMEALTLPIAALWDGRGRLILNPGCAPLAFDRLSVSGMTIDASRMTLCPVDGALLRIDGGRIGGGARLAATRLGGRIGTTPLALSLQGATLSLGDRRVVVGGLQTRIGVPARLTRLDFQTLDGRMDGGAVAGTFGGGSGQIANVPLLLGNAAGDWRFSGGRLSLTGGMGVSDAAESARFKPLAAREVTLGLAGGIITAGGTLYAPDRPVKVADVAIRHLLGDGSGTADLTVPGITFDKDFQPDALTPLTFGVIADVKGRIAGQGHIAWSADGVTSTGDFGTEGTDLAAAFGPVTGVVGRIRFTDLLALQSAPGQIATIKTINPGIPVSDGTIRFQTLPGARIQVEDGRWPFAGGTLTLDPTLLDFSAPKERRMTFHVAGMAADQFLQQFDFKNLDASGTFDGVLPMIFDATGGRIEGGNLKVREGGGTIAYVGDISQKDVGFWGNLAFQALKSLRYRSLELVMNGPLAGEMVTEVRFAGINQGKGAKSNFLVRRLQKLPFVFNIRIKAPFRGLMDSAASFYDPKRLIQRNLPALLEAEKNRAPPPVPPPSKTAPIQPPESRIVP